MWQKIIITGLTDNASAEYIPAIKMLRAACYMEKDGANFYSFNYGLKEAKDCIDRVSGGRPQTVEVDPKKIDEMVNFGFIITEHKKQYTYTLDLTRKVIKLVRERNGKAV